ncbi:sensor histidine kinase, partial [Hydrogenophaga sp.]|uniref:sensor histidine kinase n=1 Tax=Hydrogenophaga sp. TaxID=1904254 RepID=UPI0035652747
ARDAMAQAAAQARRAADVIGRLRRAVERPHADSATLALTLNDAVRRVLYLLEPECQRRRVTPVLHADAPVRVRADPVALEQIVHNLLMNALQALEQMDSAPRALVVSVSARGSIGELVVSDNGPGIAPEALPRLFEPFFSTREGGLGLGLSLCESLAQSMGGTLAAAAVVPHGAAFTLTLPLEPRA